MKRPNCTSVISKAALCIIIGWSLFVSACSPSDKYAVYQYDNGDDYFSEGLQRIVDKDGKIGFRDSIGKIVIPPRYTFAFPFNEGYAKVTDTGHREAVDNRGEYHQWISDSWYYIDRTGTKHPELIKIDGQIKSSVDGSPLQDAIVTNNRTGKSSRSDALGRFSVLCETGDSLNISYVGFISQTIQVNPADSTEWKISMREYGSIIELMLMSSVSSYDGVTMSVENLNELKSPVDSIVVSISNNTDNELMFGEMYNLEKRSGDNWIPMPYNRKYEEGEAIQFFSAVGYRYAPHSTNSNINYTQPYSLKFDKGIYDFSVRMAAGWSDDSISVVFEIR